eukprot:scaffold16035_cov61-Phaeocystis_antarctica.AAC.5
MPPPFARKARSSPAPIPAYQPRTPWTRAGLDARLRSVERIDGGPRQHGAAAASDEGGERRWQRRAPRRTRLVRHPEQADSRGIAQAPGWRNLQAQEMTAAEKWRATVTPLATTSPAARPSGLGTLGTLGERYQLERGRAEARAHLQPGLKELGGGLDAASHHATDRAAEQRGQQWLALLTEHEVNAGSVSAEVSGSQVRVAVSHKQAVGAQQRASRLVADKRHSTEENGGSGGRPDAAVQPKHAGEDARAAADRRLRLEARLDRVKWVRDRCGG